MKYQNTWFSIVFAIIIIVIASTASLYLLSFIIPYGQNVKGLENSTKAYYLWNSAVEQSLWEIQRNELGYENTTSFSGSSDYSYTIIARGNRIPAVSSGNSNFDSDWNTIGFTQPIQLSIWDGMISDWSQVNFYFQVPDFDQNGDNTSQRIAGTSTDPVLYWQLSSRDETLVPRDSRDFITAADIDSSTPFTLSSRDGVNLDNTISTFSAFYTAHCGSGNDCILRISALTGFEMLGSGVSIPYLEYYIDTSLFSIPTRFTRIDASGKSFGFRKDISVSIPQLTIDQAFDFTVFQ